MSVCHVFNCPNTAVLQAGLECPVHGIRTVVYCEKSYHRKVQVVARRLMVCFIASSDALRDTGDYCHERLTMSEPIRIKDTV
jgi:hypothetical protein